MSILSKIKKLMNLADKVDLLGLKSSDLNTEMLDSLEGEFQRIQKSVDYHKSNKTGFGLSSHVHDVSFVDYFGTKTSNKTDISFQFPDELNTVFEATPPQSPVKSLMGTSFQSPVKSLMSTPFQSPVKSGTGAKSSPPSPSKLKSPSKLPTNPSFLQFATEDLINSREVLEATHLHEMRTSQYFEKVLNLSSRVKSLIKELNQNIEKNKLKMIASFKGLMIQNNLPYVEEHATQLLSELFDIVHRDEGTFEHLAKSLSKGFAEKLKEQNYPKVLNELKPLIAILVKELNTENKDNIEQSFKKILKGLDLPDSQDFYGLFQKEHAEYLLDNDLDFHAKKFVQLFSDRLMAMNILEVRNKVVQQNPTLFNALGKVDVKPENYFELTKESKQLGQHFIQTLYHSPERIEVLLHFQKIKEKTIKTDMIKQVLSLRSEMYNQDLLYVEDSDGQRKYIQSADDCQDLNKLKLISCDELIQNIQSLFRERKLHLAASFNQKDAQNEKQVEKILDYVKKNYENVARMFASISSVSEQNTCISFFPIQFQSLPSGNLEHVCLVTTSGSTNKLDPNNKENINALVEFQKMVKAFAQESAPLVVEGQPYTFMYHDEEKGAIDVLLQQLNKGFSGRSEPLSSFAPENALVLNDPFRGCAEKKFIDFVRCQLTNPLDSKKMTILGAANLRMPIVPLKEHATHLNQSLVKLYKAYITFYEKFVKDKGIEQFETAPFKEKLKILINASDMRLIKTNKEGYLEKWKERIIFCLDMIDKSVTTEEIKISMQGLNQLLIQLSQQLVLGADLKKDTEQLYLFKEVELLKNMMCYFEWQAKIANLKDELSIMAEKDYPYLHSCSATLGKAYNLAKNRLNLFLEKINTKGGVQKIYDHCLGNYEDLTLSSIQKNEIKKRINAHCSNMTMFYSECLKFLNARKLLLETKPTAELLEEDIAKLIGFVNEWSEVAKQNIICLKEISITTKTTDLFAKDLELAVKEIIGRDLKFIDQPKKDFFSTDNLIVNYTKKLEEAQQAEQDQLICASMIPVEVSYNNTESTTLETNYIDCCCACTANKLPVLTWLTDLQKNKQAVQASFECKPFFCLESDNLPVRKVLFSFDSPVPSAVAASTHSTTLSPLVRSLNLNDTEEQEALGRPFEQSADSQEGSGTKVARKLFG